MVHTFTLNHCNIAIDGNSGNIHVLDDISFELLSYMPEFVPLNEIIQKISSRYTNEEIIEAYEEIKHLKEQGLLFTTNEVLENIKTPNMESNTVKSLCLHIAHDCNLRCEYCFASKGDYQSGRKLMSTDVALRAVDFLVKNSGTRHNIEIDFFGGEPLMNFDTVKRAAAYGREIEYHSYKKRVKTVGQNSSVQEDVMQMHGTPTIPLQNRTT